MKEMDPHTTDLGTKLVEGVQLTLPRTPVEVASPVGDQLFQVFEVRTLPPGLARYLIGPARIAKAHPEVGQDLFGDRDREGIDLQEGRRTAHPRRKLPTTSRLKGPV